MFLTSFNPRYPSIEFFKHLLLKIFLIRMFYKDLLSLRTFSIYIFSVVYVIYIDIHPSFKEKLHLGDLSSIPLEMKDKSFISNVVP